jgi:protein TonB
MTQLQYSTGSFRRSRAEMQTSPQQRLFGLAFAVTMEAAIVYALLVALGYAPAPPVQRGPIEIFNVRLPEKIDVPLPPPQTFDPPPIATPVPPEVVLTYTPPVQPRTISLPPPQPVPQAPPRVVPPPAPPVVFTPARAIAASHTIPEYPFISRRLREQGTLRLKLMR